MGTSVVVSLEETRKTRVQKWIEKNEKMRHALRDSILANPIPMLSHLKAENEALRAELWGSYLTARANATKTREMMEQLDYEESIMAEKRAYVVVGSNGEYGDKHQWVARVFLEQDMAQAVMRQLEDAAREFAVVLRTAVDATDATHWAEWTKIKEELDVGAKSIYSEILGVESDDYECQTQWKLEEARV